MTSMKSSLNRRFGPLLIALIVVCAQFAHAQSGEGIRVLRSDQQELIVAVSPRVSMTAVAGGMFLPRVDGASLVNGTITGAPMQFELGIPIVLPFPSGSSIEVVELEYDAPVAGRLAPVPELVRDASDIVREEYRVDQALYASSIQQSATVTLDYAGIVRDVYAGRIVLNPVLYNATAGTIRTLRTATVKVRFPA